MNNTKERISKHNAELVQYAITGLDSISEGQEACDLHHELFNTDYFIIGTWKAEQWLISNGGIFSAIEEIKEYEQFNFGQVTTDLSQAEKVVNMYAYIRGEEILQDCPTFRKRWNEKLSANDIKQIRKELKTLLH